MDPSEKKAAMRTAVRMIQYRERFRLEIHSSLANKGYGVEAIQSVISDLSDMEMLDDRRTAGMFARDRAHIKRQGPVRVSGELRRFGIPPAVIEEAIDSAPFKEACLEEVTRLVRRRRRSGPLTRDESERILRRVVGTLGHPYPDAMEALAKAKMESEGERPDGREAMEPPHDRALRDRS